MGFGMRARDWRASDTHVCCALAKGAANALARTWRGMRCVGASHAVSRGAYEVTRAGEARLGDARRCIARIVARAPP